MENKFSVCGTAVKPGISKNGVKYTKEECDNFSGSFKGKPILKDHIGMVDNTVGKITSSESVDGKVNYKGWIKEDGTGLIEKIEDERICEVSIGGFCKQLVKENDDDEYVTAVGLEAMELSLTPVPANAGTSLKLALESIEQHKADESVKVLSIMEKFDFTEEEKILEVGKMVEDIKVEPIAEKKEPVLEKVSYKVDVDSSSLDSAIAKAKELGSLQEKLKTTPIKEEAIAPMHGKIVKTEVVAEKSEPSFVVESTLKGNGFSLWQHPKADGSLL